MAIQLNDRDHRIFKLIDEHEVLLEKHISWFIAEDDKPVLIRDRLRKLFYLDYLLCHRHGTKLPWWTTPTKPLVYLLAPMARTVSGIEMDDTDRFDAEWQRRKLEVANLRMLCCIAQNEGKMSNFKWTTIKDDENKAALDARASFVSNGIAYDIGIVNNCTDATGMQEKLAGMKEALEKGGVEMIMIVSRDDESQEEIQKIIADSGDATLMKSCFFSTHQEIYKKGIVSLKWQNTECRSLNLFPQADKTAPGINLANGGMSQAQPMSA